MAQKKHKPEEIVHGGEKTIQRSAGGYAGAGGVKVVHWIG
ncbi:hypothetical protein SAMN05880592_1521 [Bosea sp. TND4EK4]|nr:hypothetical protein SAMN05880592_1521 [Bosea sp. TND4EK4]